MGNELGACGVEENRTVVLRLHAVKSLAWGIAREYGDRSNHDTTLSAALWYVAHELAGICRQKEMEDGQV